MYCLRCLPTFGSILWSWRPRPNGTFCQWRWVQPFPITRWLAVSCYAPIFIYFTARTVYRYLVNGVLGGPLYNATFSIYDTLVQDCLATGSYCIIGNTHIPSLRLILADEITRHSQVWEFISTSSITHVCFSYARWDGEIIGQGGPTNEQVGWVIFRIYIWLIPLVSLLIFGPNWLHTTRTRIVYVSIV